jgi:hypothetical protein
VTPLDNFQRVVGQALPSGTWQYYSVQVTGDFVQLLIVMTRDVSAGDPDLCAAPRRPRRRA